MLVDAGGAAIQGGIGGNYDFICIVPLSAVVAVGSESTQLLASLSIPSTLIVNRMIGISLP